MNRPEDMLLRFGAYLYVEIENDIKRYEQAYLTCGNPDYLAALKVLYDSREALIKDCLSDNTEEVQ
jgi:hypothetical protein